MISPSTCARKYSRKLVKKEWHVYSFGFVQDTVTAMDFTSFLVARAGKIQQQLFTPTWRHLPPPIFYDHACSLSECVKNRESGFFKNTRVFHDVFHEFTHKCSTSLSCADLNCFAQVNTSVCEQFNSYIQRIKSSAKLLSQVHFVFYLQFFIHQWNQSQFKSFEKLYRNRKLGNMSRHPDQNYGLY